jgi:MYXO-CTERM domain-containing protein
MNTPNENGKPTDNMELLKQQAAACDSGCGCHAPGKPGKARWVIGVIVLVAAGVLVARDIIKSNGASAQIPTPGYAALATTPTPAGVPAPVVEMSVGTIIGAFSELNEVAIKTDAVFIFLPGKDGVSGNPPSTAMKGAARTIEAQGKKIGLLTLKAGSSDYNQIATQMSLPGVLAMVKGRGMSGISGDITETKLVQGYLAASSAAGCGSSAGAGCCPK